MAVAFLKPDRLYLLVPLLALIAAGFFLKWRLSRRFDEFFQGEAALVSGLSLGESWLRGVFLSFAFLAMVLAFGNPSVQSRVHSFNFMAVVDITQSMWCEDYHEHGTQRSRLETAKSNLLSLLDQLPPEARFGLGVFAGRSDSLLILTPPQVVGKTRSDLKSMIQSIQYHWTWDDGTSLQDALLQMAANLDQHGGQYGKGLTLIVLTDGEEDMRYTRRAIQLDPQKFRGVHLFLAGHGTAEGAPVPEFDQQWKFRQYRVGIDGSQIISRMDEAHLKETARLLHGTYKHIEGSSDLNTLARNIAYMSGEYESKVDVSWLFWLGSFGLLVLSFVV